MPMHQRQYVELQGVHCPVCGRDSVMRNAVFDEDTPNCKTFAARCESCSAEWEDVWMRTAYSGLVVGTTN